MTVFLSAGNATKNLDSLFCKCTFTNRTSLFLLCPSLTKSEISNTGVVHPNKKRYLDLCEAMRCGSFPDDYIFTDRGNGIVRIGNSVPPLFMEAIARHIKSEILDMI